MAVTYSTDSPDDIKITDNFDPSKEIPKGVKFEDLPEDEKKRIMNRYRFSGYKPGAYQMISGIGQMH